MRGGGRCIANSVRTMRLCTSSSPLAYQSCFGCYLSRGRGRKTWWWLPARDHRKRVASGHMKRISARSLKGHTLVPVPALNRRPDTVPDPRNCSGDVSPVNPQTRPIHRRAGLISDAATRRPVWTSHLARCFVTLSLRPMVRRATGSVDAARAPCVRRSAPRVSLSAGRRAAVRPPGGTAPQRR